MKAELFSMLLKHLQPLSRKTCSLMGLVKLPLPTFTWMSATQTHRQLILPINSFTSAAQQLQSELKQILRAASVCLSSYRRKEYTRSCRWGRGAEARSQKSTDYQSVGISEGLLHWPPWITPTNTEVGAFLLLGFFAFKLLISPFISARRLGAHVSLYTRGVRGILMRHRQKCLWTQQTHLRPIKALQRELCSFKKNHFWLAGESQTRWVCFNLASYTEFITWSGCVHVSDYNNFSLCVCSIILSLRDSEQQKFWMEKLIHTDDAVHGVNVKWLNNEDDMWPKQREHKQNVKQKVPLSKESLAVLIISVRDFRFGQTSSHKDLKGESFRNRAKGNINSTHV